MDTYRRRLRLYLHYKAQQVDQAEIRLQPEWSNAQNYKALFSIRLRLARCLASRKEVHDIYADEEPGHAFAISFVEKQMVQVDGLLQMVCAKMEAASKDQEEEEALDTESIEEDGVEEELRAIQKESAKEVDELAQMESISHDKMLDIVHRIYKFISNDPAVTDNLRHMMKANMDTLVNMHAVFFAFTVLALRIDKEAPIPQCNRFLFYHIKVSDAAIRTSLLQFQQEQLVSKTALTHQLQQAYTQVAKHVGDRKKFIGFGLCLFCDLYDGAGFITTRYSISVVVALTITTAIWAHTEEPLQISALDIVCRRRLVEKYNAEEADAVEQAARALFCRYATDAEHTMDKVPWAFLFRTPYYIYSLHLVREQILNEGKKLICCF